MFAPTTIGLRSLKEWNIHANHRSDRFLAAGSAYSSFQLPTKTSIRLLKIATSKDKGTRYSFEVVDLRDEPKFDALSYSWGPYNERAKENGMTNERRFPIQCNGRQLLVTQNLRDYLRQRDKPGRIWIDAVCINQEDIIERGQQVAAMGQIYRSARKVIVWLGADDGDVKDAIGLLRSLANASNDELLSLAEDAKRYGTILGNHDNENAWRALVSLLERSYFSRAWIVQEVTLARSSIVLCGGHDFKWDDLIKVSFYISRTRWNERLLRYQHNFDNDKRTNATAVFQFKLYQIQESYKTGARLQLGDCLTFARKFNAFDPKDKVFALLGLSVNPRDRFARSEIEVDYSKSVPEIYTAATIHVIKTSADLSIFANIEDAEHRTTVDLPSWVPDWSSAEIGGFSKNIPRFSAAGKEQRVIAIDEGRKTLKIRGGLLDSVATVGESKSEVIANGGFPGWLKIVKNMDPIYFTGQSRFEVLWRTLVLNIHAHEHPAPSSCNESFYYWMMNFLAYHKFTLDSGKKSTRHWEACMTTLAEIYEADGPPNVPNPVFIQQIVSDPPTPIDLFQRAESYDMDFRLWGQVALFSTGKGYLCVGPHSTRPGDSVWIVLGAEAPMVMRQVPGTDRYTLVGEAYVHGFMHGEALKHDRVKFVDVTLE